MKSEMHTARVGSATPTKVGSPFSTSGYTKAEMSTVMSATTAVSGKTRDSPIETPLPQAWQDCSAVAFGKRSPQRMRRGFSRATVRSSAGSKAPPYRRRRRGRGGRRRRPRAPPTALSRPPSPPGAPGPPPPPLSRPKPRSLGTI